MKLPVYSEEVFVGRLLTSYPTLDREAASRLYRHWLELVRWAPTTSLIGPGTFGDPIGRHYLESLAGLELLQPLASKPLELVDIGSGAGFPGLVLAAAEPRLAVTLVESRSRKATFLRRSARSAGVDCRVVCDRIGTTVPDGLPERIDCVTSRAVRLPEAVWQALRPRFHKQSRVLLWCGPVEPELPLGMVLCQEVPVGCGRRVCCFELNE